MLTDILYNIYDFAISEQHMNFESCENMDFIAYLNYLDYLFNRKAGKEVEQIKKIRINYKFHQILQTKVFEQDH